MPALINLLILAILIFVGYYVGRNTEKKHLGYLEYREKNLRLPPVLNIKNITKKGYEVEYCQLVTGSVVLSVDYFQLIIASFIQLIGGEITVFNSLLSRAKREALLRMRTKAKNCDVIINLRIETSTISNNAKTLGCIEVLAYGTAIKYIRKSTKYN